MMILIDVAVWKKKGLMMGTTSMMANKVDTKTIEKLNQAIESYCKERDQIVRKIDILESLKEVFSQMLEIGMPVLRVHTALVETGIQVSLEYLRQFLIKTFPTFFRKRSSTKQAPPSKVVTPARKAEPSSPAQKNLPSVLDEPAPALEKSSEISEQPSQVTPVMTITNSEKTEQSGGLKKEKPAVRPLPSTPVIETNPFRTPVDPAFEGLELGTEEYRKIFGYNEFKDLPFERDWDSFKIMNSKPWESESFLKLHSLLVLPNENNLNLKTPEMIFRDLEQIAASLTLESSHNRVSSTSKFSQLEHRIDSLFEYDRHGENRLVEIFRQGVECTHPISKLFLRQDTWAELQKHLSFKLKLQHCKDTGTIFKLES